MKIFFRKKKTKYKDDGFYIGTLKNGNFYLMSCDDQLVRIDIFVAHCTFPCLTMISEGCFEFF
jgi:hypothetical protein